MTGNRAFNDLHACTVVVSGAEQQADKHNDSTADRDARVLIRQKMLEQMADFMEDDAHERTQSGADHAERHQLYNEQHICISRHTGERKRGRAAAKLQRYLMRDHARKDGRKQRRVVHHAHADNLHCEHARRKRRAEQRRKARCHAAHGDCAGILVVQVHQMSDIARNSAAELQSRALTARRAAAQVGQHRGDENARRKPQPHRMILPHRGQDKVSAALKRHIHFTVPERDENTDQRQKIQCPALLLPGFGRPFKRVLKRRADRADDHADDYRKQAPSRKNADIVPHAVPRAVQLPQQTASRLVILRHSAPPPSCNLISDKNCPAEITCGAICE